MNSSAAWYAQWVPGNQDDRINEEGSNLCNKGKENRHMWIKPCILLIFKQIYIAFLYEQNNFANVKKGLKFCRFYLYCFLLFTTICKNSNKRSTCNWKGSSIVNCLSNLQEQNNIAAFRVGCLNAILLKTPSVIVLSSQVQKGKSSFLKGIF